MAAFALLIACSSDDDRSGGSSTPSPAGTATSDCSCAITVNGQSKTVACGQDTCVGGSSYRCGDDAEVTPGGNACTASGSGSTAPTTSTVPCEVSAGSCDTAKSYCLRSVKVDANGNETPMDAVCAPLPSGCTDCDCLPKADDTWRSLKDDTANCGGTSIVDRALVTCNGSSGAIRVTCAKR